MGLPALRDFRKRERKKNASLFFFDAHAQAVNEKEECVADEGILLCKSCKWVS